jgi:plastocyanin
MLVSSSANTVYALPLHHPYSANQIIYCANLDLLKNVKLNEAYNQQTAIQEKVGIVTDDFSSKTNLNFIEAKCLDGTSMVGIQETNFFLDSTQDGAVIEQPEFSLDFDHKILFLNSKVSHVGYSIGTTCETELEKPNITYILNHEFGHVVGLDHPDVEDNNPPTMMNRQCDPYYANIQQYDIAQINSLYQTEQIKIPEHIKFNADWWADDMINDETFLKAIKWLTQEGIIRLGTVTPSNTPSDNPIPDWIKNTADWWANDQISDKEFADSLKWLIENGVIFWDVQTQSMALSETSLYGSIAVTITPDEGAHYPPYCEPDCVSPKTATIQAGETVRFLNNHHRQHTFTSGHPSYGPDELFNSLLIPSGESFFYTYEERGNYEYFCMVHPWMQGTIIVQ